jgi:hypothetical protein
MVLRMTTLAVVLALAVIGDAAAQTIDVSGRVHRIEPEQHVVVLSDGRMYRVTPNTVIHVDRRPVTLSALAPGQTVTILSGEAVALQNGQYVVVTPGSTATGASPGTPSVVIPPPATVTPLGVRQTLYGRVKDVDNDGTVKIDTGRDSFEVKMTRDLVRQIREGDTVQLDLSVIPAGTPAAAPRSR